MRAVITFLARRETTRPAPYPSLAVTVSSHISSQRGVAVSSRLREIHQVQNWTKDLHMGDTIVEIMTPLLADFAIQTTGLRMRRARMSLQISKEIVLALRRRSRRPRRVCFRVSSARFVEPPFKAINKSGMLTLLSE